MIQTENIKAILDTIEGKNFAGMQSIDLLIEYGFALAQWIAYSGQQKAETKKALHQARHAAMIKLAGSLKANSASLSPSLQKEFINDCCADEIYAYELADRCNSTCIHILDFIRSCISALKAEKQYAV